VLYTPPALSAGRKQGIAIRFRLAYNADIILSAAASRLWLAQVSTSLGPTLRVGFVSTFFPIFVAFHA